MCSICHSDDKNYVVKSGKISHIVWNKGRCITMSNKYNVGVEICCDIKSQIHNGLISPLLPVPNMDLDPSRKSDTLRPNVSSHDLVPHQPSSQI